MSNISIETQEILEKVKKIDQAFIIDVIKSLSNLFPSKPLNKYKIVITNDTDGIYYMLELYYPKQKGFAKQYKDEIEKIDKDMHWSIILPEGQDSFVLTLLIKSMSGDESNRDYTEKKKSVITYDTTQLKRKKTEFF